MALKVAQLGCDDGTFMVDADNRITLLNVQILLRKSWHNLFYAQKYFFLNACFSTFFLITIWFSFFLASVNVKAYKFSRLKPAIEGVLTEQEKVSLCTANNDVWGQPSVDLLQCILFLQQEK